MSARRFTLAVIASLCAIGGSFALGSPAMALNVHVFSGSFGEEGAGAGQLKEPNDVAVDYATHNVYVADSGNKRVEEFTSAGVYLGQLTPPGGFESPTAIAVDNSGSPLDPSAGDVYVIDSVEKGRNAIDKFSDAGVYENTLTAGIDGEPFEELKDLAVDAAGTLWVDLVREVVTGVETHFVESFSDAQNNSPNTRIGNLGSRELGFTVDSEDRLSAARQSSIIQRTAAGQEKEFFTGETIKGLSADSKTNYLYASDGEQVTSYDTEAKVLEHFGSGHLSASSGLAVDSSTGTVYVVDRAANQIVIFAQVVVPDVRTGEEPTNLQQEGSVTLDGTVDPHAIPLASCEFEYGTDSSYGSTAACEPSPGSSNGPVAVHADIHGLTPLTTYHYRLVAANANGASSGVDRSFTAGVRASVDAESVFDVSADGASFSGQVNPGGTDTTYRFEYGHTASYGESVPGNAGSGTADVAVQGHAQNLQAGTVYHYRLIAESPLGTAVGEDQTFLTQPAPSASELPDARAWELVSPPNKQGASLMPIGGTEGRLIQAAADGSAISYAATGPTEEAPPGDRSPEDVQILSKLTSGGWTTKVIATPHDTTHEGDAAGHASEYRFFSSDLSLGLVEPIGATHLSEETSERTPYLRHDTTCEATPAACYQPLVTASNVLTGTKFGGEAKDTFGEVNVEGATSDLSHIVLFSNIGLTLGGASGLYEWSGGKLTFLAKMNLGEANGSVIDARHAISADGSRVIGESSINNEHALIMRDVTAGTTTRLDLTEAGAPGSNGEPLFQTASSDGSRVFFTDDVPLTADSTALGAEPDLYEYDVTTGKVSDLSVPLNPGEHAEVLGDVLGASEDGSYVYFVADGVLAAGAAQGDCSPTGSGSGASATCNLYVSHNGVTKFVANLSEKDGNSFASGKRLDELTARVSPNGRWLAFMSDQSLTGYDNRDAASGEADEEVFLYNADPGPGEKQLVCASCNSTGGRPAGMLMTRLTGEPNPLVDGGTGIWQGRWLAAAVPGWTSNTGATSAYQSRYLSDSGRLFFDSSEALAPQDTDGTWDVYQYEPPTSAAQAPPNDTCTSESATFSISSAGCVDLISSGSSHQESVFLDASETGDDVFFLTAAGLSSQDYDGALDVYDAHVCSAGSPCLSAPGVTPPPCSTGDACKAAPTPQPEIFGSPSSETFSGAGNVTAGSSVAPKALANTQKLAKALRTCRKKPKGKRAACERQARKKYAKKAAPKSRVAKSVSSRTGR